MKTSDIIIYTDGASRGNPGRGGWGALVATEKKVVELGGNDKHTTNNKMELEGAIEALSFVVSIGGAHNIDMRVDSRYVINGITKWIHGWKKNSWINSKKEEVLNRDLWEALASLVSTLENGGSKIKWNYTPGHSGILGNERVDEISTMCADGEYPKLFNGPRSEYKINLTKHTGVAGKILSKKSKSNSKVKAYSYLSLVNGKLERHATWASCEKRVKGTSGAKFKKSVSAEDENSIICSWGIEG
ncbi:MAG: ribonuclease HI [Candidatus Pacebacteria bacterium]|nr:ribonuclease HI [Candidatus Paceibacterota bacterium]